MFRMINPNKVGLVIAALIGGWHLVWAALVAAGWAQPLINFIFWAHMIKPVYVIGPFDAVAAGTLVVITLVWGYVLGFIGGGVWNKLHR
jgi:hypothetical protein